MGYSFEKLSLLLKISRFCFDLKSRCFALLASPAKVELSLGLVQIQTEADFEHDRFS